MTPLMVAIKGKDIIFGSLRDLTLEKRKLEIVKMLCKHPKIDINIADELGWTSLHLACAIGSLDIVLCLLRVPSINVNIWNKFGQTLLDLARKDPFRQKDKGLVNYLESYMKSCQH